MNRQAVPPTGDPVNHPGHYGGFSNGAEVIDITENLNFNRGNAVMYIARAGRKSEDTELQDLEKAVWYLNREIERFKKTAEALKESKSTMAEVVADGILRGLNGRVPLEF